LFVSTFAMGAAAAGAHISMTILPMAWFDQRTAEGGRNSIGDRLAFVPNPSSYLLPREAKRRGECAAAALDPFAVVVISAFLLKENRVNENPCCRTHK
jgi:hypothetical protein